MASVIGERIHVDGRFSLQIHKPFSWRGVKLWRGCMAFIFGWTFYVLGGSIGGTVRDAQTGKHLSGVRVALSGDTVTTDSLGRFVVGPLPAGSYNLAFSAPGYATLLRPDVYVAGEGDVRCDVELEPYLLELDKITVRATAFRTPPEMAASVKVMTMDEILRAPGALADVQRVVQDLPSVASSGDNVNEVIVRGGVPGENLFVMDNIDIPNPNHFAQQGSGGGVVSLVNPLLVKNLSFSAGAPPAQYGGKASSVLSVELRDGNDRLILGGVDIGIGGAGGHIEGPLWKNATFMASAARSFLDFVARFEPSTAVPDYWGCQAKITQRLGHGHKLIVNALGGASNIRIDNAARDIGTRGNKIGAGGTVYATGTTLKSFWTSNISSLITISATGNGFDRQEYTQSGGSSGRIDYFRNESLEQEQSIKAEISVDRDGGNRISAGGVLRRADFDIEIEQLDDTLVFYRDEQDSVGMPVIDSVSGLPITTRSAGAGHGLGYKYGAYLSAILRPVGNLKIVPGIRIDGFTYTGDFNVSPRLSAVYAAAPSLNLTLAAGIQYQDPDYVALVASPSNKKMDAKRAATTMGGVEYLVNRWDMKLSCEGFYKRYDRLPIDSSLLLDVPLTSFTKTNTLLSKGMGYSYGIEFFAQKKLTRHFSGTAAYAYSQCWYDDIRPRMKAARYPADYDFRHTLTCIGGWKFELLSAAWYQRLQDRLWFAFLSWISPVADRNELSLRFRYLGGRPYTQPIYIKENRLWTIMPDQALNRHRYPPYHSLDVRWERRFGFGFLQMIYYFELQNLYNRSNVWQYLFIDGRDTPIRVNQLPFFPAGGIIVGF